MRFLKLSSTLLLALGFIVSCNSIPDKDWTSAVPKKTPFVVIPTEQMTISSVLESPYIPFLDDVTSSAIQLVSQVDSSAQAPLSVDAIMLYPGTGNKLQSVWATTAPDDFANVLRNRFYRDFAQNQYHFQGATIHRLHIQDRTLYACQLHDLLLLSESSLAVEEAVRAYMDLQPSADISDLELSPGSIVMNTPSLDNWVEQLAQVIHRPSIIDAFSGTKPAVLQLADSNSDANKLLEFSGTLPLDDAPKSDLVAAFTESNATLQLDRYISSNAAAFGIFRLTPRLAPPPSVTDGSRLDSVLIEDKVLYSRLAKSLDPEFALVTFAESGFLSTGEHLFIRTLSDRSAFLNELQTLTQNELIQKVDNTYLVSSQVLARLISSELSSFQDFYLNVTGNAVVISKRKGLAELVASDRNRRRVIYYEQRYMDIREEFPEEVSSLIVLNTDFDKFVDPFLAPDNYVDAITSNFDLLTITTRLNQDENSLAFNLATYSSEETDTPYREQWLFSTDGSEMTGKPVLADIGGSSRNEIIFATETGNIYALAADGTVVLELQTEDGDVPVGSPVVYDWYGTNQNIIMVAAGNKVYGWNDNGDLLPRFPFILDEPVTTPLLIDDIDRNSLPDALVATADRRLHALDGRGNDLSGWPVSTNALIQSKPLIEQFQGSRSIIAFSENAIHAWTPNGRSKPGFPKFVNASLKGSPVVHNGNILGGAADGYLYTIGNNIQLSDTLNAYSNTSDSSGIGAVYVSNSSLIGTPSVHELSVNTETGGYSGSMILTMSSNGSVFLLGEEGRLYFTQNMGQPSAAGSSPLLTDLTRNNRSNIVALGDYGRLYAWSVNSGERMYSIPTSHITSFTIADIDADGYKELIAQTREGVRCWTIYGER